MFHTKKICKFSLNYLRLHSTGDPQIGESANTVFLKGSNYIIFLFLMVTNILFGTEGVSHLLML